MLRLVGPAPGIAIMLLIICSSRFSESAGLIKTGALLEDDEAD